MPLDGRILMVAAGSGAQTTLTLEQLLPHSFGPEFLP